MLGEHSPSSPYVQPTLGHALRVWWAFYWRTTIFSLVAVFVISRLLGFVGGAARSSTPALVVTAQVVSAVAAFITAVFVMQRVLRKNFRGFRIGLASLASLSGEPEYLQPTLRRALRVWWAYFWRMIFGLVIAFVAVVLPLSYFVGLFGPSLVFATIFSLLMWTVIAMLVSTYVLWYKILDEDIADFHVTLISREAVPAAPAAAAPP